MSRFFITTLTVLFIFASGSTVLAAHGGAGNAGASSSFRSQSMGNGQAGFGPANSYQYRHQNRYQEQQDAQLQQQTRTRIREHVSEDAPVQAGDRLTIQERLQIRTDVEVPVSAE